MVRREPPAAAQASKEFMEYDVSEWPYVRAVVKPVYPNEEQFQAHLDCFSELLQGGELFTISFNLEQAKLPAMDLLKKLAAFMNDHRPHIQANLAASTVVTTSMLVHGALRVLFSLKTPVKPQKSFDTDAEAKQWLARHYAATARNT